ncbi:hypothetical protein POJ06DRAFT_39688 [Lipomyces tetrasporus]|uniref:Actin binding protein n=1 Tax=Lipomyces tetrasporus TaxID=54092 RepID=A0AAD7QKU8_9ASCO|nr:uncharacterized protein POJ06DRAFT_39688 [Lipomyces tetrasporus]KAJ8097108.1 hypothetical protein POJ06DRAFT_39688 [Lipomyces tetrasporus]
MTSIDLSSNAREIQSAYDSIVEGDPKISWALFSYGAGFNNNALKLQATGAGDLDELQDEFSDGRVQYAFARVTDPNTQLPKFVLIGWCGEGVPERTKGYFSSHFNSVARLFRGYHVQITARSEDDVAPDEILRKVADASGSKYSVADLASRFSKPPPVRPNYTESHVTSYANESDWGDTPATLGTEVSKVQSAYKPVKVDLAEIRKSGTSQRAYVEPVKGAYQPIGKVDIAALRAGTSNKELEAAKPEVVKGTYQPIGKVDIAAIRAEAKQKEEYVKPAPTSGQPEEDKSASFIDRTKAFSAGPTERLSELPKPKVDKPALSSRFGGNRSFGTAPPLPKDQFGLQNKVVGGISKNFANEGGKTPAQLWAERKARAPGGVTASNSSSATFGSSGFVPKPAAKDENGEGTSVTVSAMRDRFAKASIASEEKVTEEEEEPSFAARSSSPIRLAHPVSSTSTIIRPGGLPPRPLPAKVPSTEPEPVPEEPEPELEAEEEPEVEELPALNMSSKPDVSSFTMPAPEPAPETEPEPEPEVESASFEKRRAAAAAAIAGGGIVGAPAPSRQIAPEPEVQPAAASGSGKSAIVMYEYQKDEENEINLVEGETIYDLEMIDDGWWAGTNSVGEHGLFPSNYVELQGGEAESTPEAALEPAVSTSAFDPTSAAMEILNGPSALASYDYEAQEDNELSFPEGAIIEDIQFPDEDWWSGVYNGERKLFPANYVSLQ